MNFVGLQNYIDMLHDGGFWGAFIHNLQFICYSVCGQIGFALIISVLLMSRMVKFPTIHRVVIFFPVLLSAVVVGFLWRLIYNKDYGILNKFLIFIHQPQLIRAWLDNPDIIIRSLAIPKIWQYIGNYMIIILAGIQNIDQSVLDSAEMDGAQGWKKLVYIILPLIKNTLFVSVMLCISGNMKTFDQIFVMTGGGPGTSSDVIALYTYRISMLRMNYGYGSCLAIGVLFLSLALIAFSRSFNKKEA
jgi:raffinose/stachyose/melibiose transport system permease protein